MFRLEEHLRLNSLLLASSDLPAITLM